MEGFREFESFEELCRCKKVLSTMDKLFRSMEPSFFINS
jgi:hypothetical protein